MHRAWFQTFGANAMAQIRKGTILEVDKESTPALTHSGLNNIKHGMDLYFEQKDLNFCILSRETLSFASTVFLRVTGLTMKRNEAE